MLQNPHCESQLSSSGSVNSSLPQFVSSDLPMITNPHENEQPQEATTSQIPMVWYPFEASVQTSSHDPYMDVVPIGKAVLGAEPL